MKTIHAGTIQSDFEKLVEKKNARAIKGHKK